MSKYQSQSILETSKITTIVPDGSIDDLVSLLSSSDARSRRDGSSILDELPQRKTLFLDEIITILVVLETPSEEDDDPETLATKLVISLECFAVGSRRSGVPEQDDKAMTIKDLVASWTNSNEGDRSSNKCSPPSYVVDEAGEAKYVVWKAQMHLNRARIRSSNPSLFFSASASISNNASLDVREDEDDYLSSGVPESMNLFDSLQSDPSFKGHPPILLASRLSKILPTGVEGRDLPWSLRNTSSRNLTRLVPAFRSRIRCTRIGASPNHAKVLACLEVDVAPYIDGRVAFEEPKITLSDGAAEPLTEPTSLSFPLSCEPHDSISFIYNLTPNWRHAAFAEDNSSSIITVLLNASLTISGETPIQMQSIYRLSADLSILHSKPYFLQTRQPQAHEAPTSHKTSTHSLPHLVTITISSPPTTKVGGMLNWSLLVANNSTTQTLNLAVVPITHDDSSPFDATGIPPTTPISARTASKQRHAHKPTLSTSLFTATGRPEAPPSPPPKNTPARLPLTATDARAPPLPVTLPAPDTALNEQFIILPPSVISLTPDIRTGTLRPGASMKTAVQFLVLRAGVVHVQALRVVDLGHGEEDGNGVGQAGSGRSKAVTGGQMEGDRPFVDLRGPLLPDVFAFEAGTREEEDDGARDSEDTGSEHTRA